MDPLYDSEGKPFAPVRFERLLREQFLISSNLHTSVTDLDKITPREREIYLKLIAEMMEERKKLFDNAKSKK